jgi:hypothetical protein
MRTAALKPGDVVEADVRGRIFPAQILSLADEDIPGRPIRVQPLVPNTFFHLAARQIRRQLNPQPAHRR